MTGLSEPCTERLDLEPPVETMTKRRTRDQVVEIVCRGRDGVETTQGAASSPPGLHCPRWHGVVPSILFAETRGRSGRRRWCSSGMCAAEERSAAAKLSTGLVEA